MNKLILLICSFLFFQVDSGAQNISTVTGEVTEAETGMPIPGVNVMEQGTTNGVMTDFDGNYSIEVPEDATLEVSFIGYATQTVEVDGRSEIDIAMETETAALEEVVVVGYGTQKKVNLTGAISTVQFDDMEDRPITNATQALAGVAAGVSISQTSGQPGADGGSIRIRGVGTLGNNDPLVLVDGIQESMGNVNVSDIESVSVLKDAASAAIYGSRAANGVILITTKSGESGKMTVNYEGYTGFQKPTQLPEYETNSVRFMEYLNQAIYNESPSAQSAFTNEQIEEYRTGSGSNPYLYPNTDWQELMYRDARISAHNFSVRGGGEKTVYSFSAGYLDQDGILLGTNTKQYTARLNIDTKVSEKFNYQLKLSGRYDDVREPVVGASTGIGWVDRGVPTWAPYLEDGKYASTWVGFLSNTHPLAGVKEGKNNTEWDNLLAHISGEYEILKGLKLKGTAAVKTYHMLNKVFRPEVFLYNPKTQSTTAQNVGGKALSAWNRYDTKREITFITTLHYEKSIANAHNITALGGFQQETSKFQRLQASKEGLPSNELHEISAGSVNPTAEGSTVNYGLQSFFGRVTYNFKQKYLFEANVRYDGSSNFADGKKWGVFPSFSAGWNIDKESFFNDIEFIDNLKLRASWGKLGNQAIAPNQYTPMYALGQDYSYGGQLVGGAAQTDLPNPEITWETSTQTDIGLDLRAFGGKLGLVVDYYHKITDDILRPINVSGVVGGLQAPTVNLASVENKGLEFALSHRNVVGEFSYNVDANLTTIDNKVIKLDAPSIGAISWLAEGRPIDEFYTIKMLGIFQSQQEIDEHGAQLTAQPGDIKFEDLNNDGEINDEDRQPIASSIPKYIYGLNISAEYRGFDFSVLFQGVEGNHAITEEEQKPFFNNAGLPKFWVENAWTAENPNNKYPRLVRGSNYINNVWRNSSFLVEDASYLRVKNAQIGYTLPLSITERLKLKRLRIYANAQNPLTFTSYRGLDPEKNPFQIRGSYSNVQTYSIGLNLSL